MHNSSIFEFDDELAADIRLFCAVITRFVAGRTRQRPMGHGGSYRHWAPCKVWNWCRV